MRVRLFVCAVAILVLACGAAYAQQSASSGIIGQVTDASKSSVPGATVTVINVAPTRSGVPRQIRKDVFRFPICRRPPMRSRWNCPDSALWI